MWIEIITSERTEEVEPSFSDLTCFVFLGNQSILWGSFFYSLDGL